MTTFCVAMGGVNMNDESVNTYCTEIRGKRVVCFIYIYVRPRLYKSLEVFFDPTTWKNETDRIY